MERYRFAFKPKWILGHLIAISFVIAAINLGFWQISRLHERQAFNRGIVANMEAPAASISRVLPVASDFDDVPRVLDRHVTATGRYLIPQEVVITAQANPEGVPGVWIVSPLLLDDGRVLLVNRGWLPSTGQITSPPAAARPPTGRVTVTGLVSETQTQTEGESPERNARYQSNFLRIDVARISRQFSRPLVPAFLQRTAQRPADPGPTVPQLLDPPQLNNGPHLSYTIQWFAFATVVLVGYPFLLWLMARDRDEKRRSDELTVDLPPGAFIDAEGVIDLTEVDAGARHD